MISIDKQLTQAQEEWDAATHAYSRYPRAEQWQAFLKAKEKVLTLRRQREAPDESTSSQKAQTLKTSDLLCAFLQTVAQATNKQMVQACNLTDDKVRHGLLSLLKQQKIEKLDSGLYKIKTGKE